MAKNNTDAYLKECARLAAEQAATMKKLQIVCNHDEGEPLIPFSSYKGNKSMLNVPKNYDRIDCVVVHPTCGTAFDGNSFTRDEIQDSIFKLKSAFHQVKMATASSSSMDDTKRATIDTMLANLCTIEAEFFDEFYPGFVSALAKMDSGKNKRRNDGPRVGHVGLSSHYR